VWGRHRQPRAARNPGLDRFNRILMACYCTVEEVGDVDGEVSVETVILLRKLKRPTIMNFVLAGGERLLEDEVSIAGRSGGATRLR